MAALFHGLTPRKEEIRHRQIDEREYRPDQVWKQVREPEGQVSNWTEQGVHNQVSVGRIKQRKKAQLAVFQRSAQSVMTQQVGVVARTGQKSGSIGRLT